jgi:heptosyltransferase-3
LAEPLSFLVINVCRIGDTLLVTPSVRALSRAYPDARITVLCHPKRAEVMHHLPFIARVGAISKRTVLFRGWIAPRRYDYALVYGFDKPLVTYALRVARHVVAFKQGDSALDARLYRAVDRAPFQSEHSVLQLLRLPAAIDVQPAGLRIAYRVTAEENAWAQARLRADLPSGAAPLIGLQVASFHTKSYRDWPIEHFAETARRLGTEWPKGHFLLFGGSDDRERTAWLKTQLGARATDYAGRLTLRQTAAMMNALDLYIGVDTGPTHIMSAFDRPLIGLYHCFSPSRLIGPLEHPHFFPVEHPRPHGCEPDTPMAEISVDTVVGTARRALGPQRAVS